LPGKVSYKDCGYVHHSLHMPHSSTDLAVIFFSSYGTHFLDHLGLAEVAVVAVLEVNADLIGV
jgi:hypothetical protein